MRVRPCERKPQTSRNSSSLVGAGFGWRADPAAADDPEGGRSREGRRPCLGRAPTVAAPSTDGAGTPCTARTTVGSSPGRGSTRNGFQRLLRRLRHPLGTLLDAHPETDAVSVSTYFPRTPRPRSSPRSGLPDEERLPQLGRAAASKPSGVMRPSSRDPRSEQTPERGKCRVLSLAPAAQANERHRRRKGQTARPAVRFKPGCCSGTPGATFPDVHRPCRRKARPEGTKRRRKRRAWQSTTWAGPSPFNVEAYRSRPERQHFDPGSLLLGGPARRC